MVSRMRGLEVLPAAEHYEPSRSEWATGGFVAEPAAALREVY